LLVVVGQFVDFSFWLYDQNMLVKLLCCGWKGVAECRLADCSKLKNRLKC